MNSVTNTPIAARGTEKHHHQGVPERFVLDRPSTMYTRSRRPEIIEIAISPNAFCLLFEITGHHQVIAHGTGYPVKQGLYVPGHGAQVAPRATLAWTVTIRC